MDHEPTLIGEDAIQKPEIFSDAEFHYNVLAVEHTLNSATMPPRERKKYKTIALSELSDHLGTEYVKDQVDVTGYAYLADKDGRVLLDNDGDALQGYVDYEETIYGGIRIIKVPGVLTTGTNQGAYKVVCRFKNTTYQDDGTSFSEVFYVQPSNILRFHPTYDNDTSAEDLTDADMFEKFADKAEKEVRHYSFTLAHGSDQHRALRILGLELHHQVELVYGDEIVSINTNEFFVVTPGKGDSPSSMYLIDQLSDPPEERTSPVGIIRACQYIEEFQNPGINLTKIKGLIRDSPCLVVDIENSNATCLVPIRAINFIDFIDTDDKL